MTAELKPPKLVTVTVEVAVEPALTLIVLGLVESEKPDWKLAPNFPDTPKRPVTPVDWARHTVAMKRTARWRRIFTIALPSLG